MKLTQSSSAEREMPRALSDAKNRIRERIYVVAVSHLDTQWQWTVRDTIARHLPRTLRENFRAFTRSRQYVVSFDGAFRYALMREYYPREFEKLKSWVLEGRWALAGAFWDAADVNIPSPESLIRQILYGTEFFEREFGRRPREIFLPDCFGFGWALPSVASHCGLRSFSSQKLSRGRAAAEIPFDLGVWCGPDGSEILAALPLYGYGEPLPEEFPDSETLAALDRQERASGVRSVVRYFGVGDTGGALDDKSIGGLDRACARAAGESQVIVGGPGRWAQDLGEDECARLPRHRGELLLGVHGTGCYTAQAAMKRWNRRNEQLADAAERAACAAHRLGGLPYPTQMLRSAWERFLWHQFHDDLTGTSIPAAYDISWNDEAISLNQFTDVLEAGVAAVARGLDTRGEGTPVVVYNPLSWEREDVVQARLRLDSPVPAALRVFGPDGGEVQAQSKIAPDGTGELLFPARVPALGFAVFDVRAGDGFPAPAADLLATVDALENTRYRARLDRDGNLASLSDRKLGRELLAAPHRLELLPDFSARFPAWEIRREDVSSEPREILGGPADVRVVEAGPVRVALEVRRRGGSSLFVQRLRLSCGEAADRLEIETEIDWRAKGRLLKASFPFRLQNPVATYDLGLGAIERGVNTESLYEVPAQQWADLSERSGIGVAVFNDCKYGWDHPGPGTLRMTLLHTPRVGRRFRDQRALDRGRHRLLYAIAGHAGDWRGVVPAQAAALNQPLRAFRTAAHPGALGKSWSFLNVSGAGVAVRAVKRAESSDEYVVRLQETGGAAVPAAKFGFASPVVVAREVTGAEEPLSGGVTLDNGCVVTSLRAYQPRAFSVSLAAPPVCVPAPCSTPLSLPFDISVVSLDSDRSGGDFDGKGHSLPGELLSSLIDWAGVRFELGPLSGRMANAVVCRGQKISLAEGRGSRLYLLAASAGGETSCAVKIGGRRVAICVPDWTATLGRADRRRWGRLVPGHLRRQRIAWVGTHRHGPKGDEPYLLCHLFAIGVAIPSDAREIELPRAPRVRVLAASIVENGNDGAELLQLFEEWPERSSPSASAKEEFIGS